MKNIQEQGITLVALVITIIILLILAGVTIGTALGQNGLFKMARKSAEEYDGASRKESEELSTFEGEFDEIEEKNDKDGIYIHNEEEIKKFRDEVNSGNDFEGKNVYLTTNIELTEENWTPIGKEESTFNGTFDGKGHKIKNLKGNYDGSNEKNIGFFGNVINATVKNLTTEGEITSSGEIIASGGIIGYASGNIKIESCNNNVNITSESTNGVTGGVIAKIKQIDSELNIKNCKNYGQMIGKNSTGGIIGEVTNNIKITVENSINEGNISSTYLTGGCIGLVDNNSKDVNINDFKNKGNLSGDEKGAGGCIGWINHSNGIAKLYNIVNESEEINGVNVTGGVIGYSGTGLKVLINSSYNKSKISSTSREAGGIIGDSDSINYIFNSYNVGSCKGNRGAGRNNRICMC